MSIIRFIRHGETESNVGNVTRDSKLTHRGRVMARELSGEYDLVVLSTMWRTHETFKESKIQARRVIYLDDLRECLDNNPDNSRVQEDPSLHETTSEMIKRIQRAKEFIEELLPLYPRICIIGHGVILGYLTQVRYRNCQSVELTWDQFREKAVHWA